MKNTKIEPLADAVKQFEHWRTTRTKGLVLAIYTKLFTAPVDLLTSSTQR